jgi:hypothetical protein
MREMRRAADATEGPRAMGSRPEAGGSPSRREGFGRGGRKELHA